MVRKSARKTMAENNFWKSANRNRDNYLGWQSAERRDVEVTFGLVKRNAWFGGTFWLGKEECMVWRQYLVW